MPQQKRNQKRAGKKPAKKNTMHHLPLVAQQPTAKRILVTYGQASTLAESAAGSGVVVFYRLNSVYDPDLTGIGTAALGLGYWANFFQNYRVTKATARVQATATLGVGGIATFIMGAVPQSTMPASKAAWRATPTAKMGVCVTSANGGKNVVELTSTYDMAKVLRVNKAEFRSDMDFTGGTASNPARAVNLFLSLDSAGSATVASASYNIQITYEVEWFNPLPVQ